MALPSAFGTAPITWGIALVAAFLLGTSKTGLSGAGILAIALFAQVLPARASTGIVLPLLVVSDVVAVIGFRRHAVWSHLVRLIPITAVGVVIGALALRSPWLKSNDEVRMAIGGIVVAIVLWIYYQRWHGADQQSEQDAARSTSWTLLLATGLSAGVLTMVANAAGPIMVFYLLAAGLPKYEFIGTGAWFFFVMNLFKLPFSANLGLMTQESILFDVWLAPVAIAGALMGKWLMSLIKQKTFIEITLALTLVSGLNMLIGPMLRR